MIKNAKVLKFVILGDGAVGKTTLAKVFCDSPYVDQIMTIGIDIHAKEVYVNGQRTVLQIWDLSGQDQFKFLIPTFVGGANGAIIAYDRMRYESFLHLDFWISELRKIEPTVPIFLISTKADMKYHPQFDIEKVKDYVQTNNLIGFEETSAKISFNINVPFKRLLENIFEAKPDQLQISFMGPEEEFKGTPPPEPQRYSPMEPAVPLESPQTNLPLIDAALPSSPAPVGQPPIEARFPSSPASVVLPPIESALTSSSIHIGQTMPNSTPIENNIRQHRRVETCSFCNSPLRQSQIRLKRLGEKVLCHNCFNQT